MKKRPGFVYCAVLLQARSSHCAEKATPYGSSSCRSSAEHVDKRVVAIGASGRTPNRSAHEVRLMHMPVRARLRTSFPCHRDLSLTMARFVRASLDLFRQLRWACVIRVDGILRLSLHLMSWSCSEVRCKARFPGERLANVHAVKPHFHDPQYCSVRPGTMSDSTLNDRSLPDGLTMALSIMRLLPPAARSLLRDVWRSPRRLHTRFMRWAEHEESPQSYAWAAYARPRLLGARLQLTLDDSTLALSFSAVICETSTPSSGKSASDST